MFVIEPDDAVSTGMGTNTQRKEEWVSLQKQKVFATKVIKRLRGDFWTNGGICFYLDGVSFTHKYNP